MYNTSLNGSSAIVMGEGSTFICNRRRRVCWRPVLAPTVLANMAGYSLNCGYKQHYHILSSVVSLQIHTESTSYINPKSTR